MKAKQTHVATLTLHLHSTYHISQHKSTSSHNNANLTDLDDSQHLDATDSHHLQRGARNEHPQLVAECKQNKGVANKEVGGVHGVP